MKFIVTGSAGLVRSQVAKDFTKSTELVYDLNYIRKPTTE